MINSPNTLNLAAFCSGTRTLGPGLRAAVWVQGCSKRCPDCISPDWLSTQPNQLISPQSLAERILANPDVSGITLSGGEPFLQPVPLIQLLRHLQNERFFDVICFTGFTLAEILSDPPAPGALYLLDELDLLIDGPYIKSLNDGAGLRGSINQRFQHLSPHFQHVDFTAWQRNLELRISDGQAMLAGIPPAALDQWFQTLSFEGSLPEGSAS
jgi:anaerobic ribonucleoside-triphosphate reductase activating protein